MKIIAFTGNMGVGKSEAINTLSTLVSTDLKNIKFAQPLYDIQAYIYKRTDLPPPLTKDRKLLQWLGTEWGRSVDKDLWLCLWLKEVNAFQQTSPFGVVTCDDLRFNNEAEAIKEVGGVIIHIKSDRNQERINTESGIKNHVSESGIDQKYIDYTVENNSTIEDFTKILSELFGKILTQ